MSVTKLSKIEIVEKTIVKYIHILYTGSEWAKSGKKCSD